MHTIQKKIFDKLYYVSELRYAELRPNNVESNHFAYHLKQLAKHGIIQKTESKAYRLSYKGMAHAERLSYTSMNPRLQPKIISLLDITNSNGDTVLFRRKHQPYLGMVSFPTGKLHLKETAQEAGERELKEKLGTSVPIVHRGIATIMLQSDSSFISQAVAHVFHGEYNGSLPIESDKRADRFWGNAAAIEDSIVPGFFEIKKLLQSEQFFYEDFVFDVD